MSKKIVLVFSVILVLGLGATVQASTLFHWTFDGGTVGNELISDTDIAGGLVVTKFRDAGDPDPIYDVNYGEGNLIYNSGGTSADFHNDPTTGDPGVGLFVNDYGSDTAMDLSTLGKFTIEAFIYPYTNRQSVIVRKYKGDGQYYLDLRDSGDVQFSINADENFAAAGADAVKENEWAHVAAVFDETDTEDPMKIYVNGILMGTGGDGARVGDSSTSLGIGAIVRDDQDPPGNSGQFFNGRIDEVRISDKALSPSEFLLYAKTGAASRPSPMNRAINICDGVTLSWVAGQFAAEHDIFLGTSFDDVNDATTATAGIFKSTQILDANTYTPSGLVLATTYYWRIDEVNDLDANSPWKGSVWEFTTNDGSAYGPNPADAATAVDLEVVLGWNAGCEAVSHEIYFGADFNDVDGATASVHPNVEYATSGGTSYDPTTVLDYFTYYYWRVDEVGTSETWKGQVWSFRSQSAIGDPNRVAWYKLDETSGDTAADSSGYEHHATVDGPDDGPDWDANDGRFGGSLGFDDDTDVVMPPAVLSTLASGITVTTWLKDADRSGNNNWVFGADGVGGSSIQAAVADVNGVVSWQAGDDANDIITWDLDGQSAGNITGWHHWAFVKDEVSGNMSIYFDAKIVESNDVVTVGTLANVAGRQMRIGAAQGHSNDFAGRVDDFRVYTKALTATEIRVVYRGGQLELAWAPEPGDNGKDVARDVVLRWSPGDYAVQHDVYFGTDWDDVNDATTVVSLGVYKGRHDIDANSYVPPSDLALNTAYYWRVDEVNDPCVWKGPVWTFTVANFIIIDDFESYNDSDNSIYYTWSENAGAVLEDFYPGDPAHLGEQSMWFLYYNDYGPDSDYSEVGRDLSGMDFTQAGVKALTLYFYGNPTNDASSTEEPYVGIDDGSTYAESRYLATGNPISDIQEEEWHEWNIPLSSLSGPTMTSIQNIYIGFGQRGSSVEGGCGEVYFDDVRLYPPRCRPEPGLHPVYDWSGNCIVDYADIGLMGEQWLRSDANLSPVTNPGITGLVGWWKLDDGSGTTATDSSVNSNTGTLEGSTTWVSGKIGSGAVAFGSDDARIRIPPAAVLMPANTISVTAWIYPTEEPDYSARIVAKGIDTGDWEAYYLQFDGSATWTIRDPNHDNQPDNGLKSDQLIRDEWIHVAGTYDGDVMKLYVNGQLEDSNNIGNIGGILQDINDLCIGNRSDGNDRAFVGTIDDVRVYNRALSAAEVGWLATDGSGYVPLNSQVNIYDLEPAGQKAVNFRDFAKFMTAWLNQQLWPPE